MKGSTCAAIACVLTVTMVHPTAQRVTLSTDLLKDWRSQQETMLRIADAMLGLQLVGRPRLACLRVRRLLRLPGEVEHLFLRPQVRRRVLVALDAPLHQQRLGLKRLSLTADMLKERCSPEHTPFQELAQADVFLTLFGVVRMQNVPSELSYRLVWRPRTTVFLEHGQRFRIFLRLEEEEYRHEMRTALGVASAADMAARVKFASENTNNFESLSLGHFSNFDFVEATNLSSLTK